MTSSNIVSPYSEPSRFIAGELKPTDGRVGQPVLVYPNSMIDPTILSIRDWLPWSIINIFISGIFIGLIPMTFSHLCRRYKTENNASRARKMSKLALVFNILATLFGIALWVVLIVLLVNGELTFSTYCDTYPYCRY